MNVWVEVLLSGGPKLITVGPLTSSQSVTIPFGVSNLETMSGKGADGYVIQDTRSKSATIDVVITYQFGTGGPNSGSFGWSDFQSDATNAAASINGGGSGSVVGVEYYGYLADNTYRITLGASTAYSNSVPGSASVSYSGGWQTSGALPTTDSANSSSVSWLEYTGTTTTVTGAAATGFGRSLPGGVGVPATVTTLTNVPVTGGSSYSIVVPSGGSITITYYQ